MRLFFKRLFCIHDWQPLYNLGFGRYRAVCKKCGLEDNRINDHYPY